MKLSMEIPTKLLKQLSPLCEVDFILAHLVTTDKAYADFYAKSTRYKILDNGLHELGKPMSAGELKEAALLCKPDVIIAPDYYEDAKATCEGFYEAKRRLGNQWKLGFVLHGKDPVERIELFNKLRPEAHMLCLPYKFPRYEWFTDIVGRTPHHVAWPPRIHLLGVKSFKELTAFRDFFGDLNISNRCSVDTGKAIKFGLSNTQLTENLELRGNGLIDHKATPTAENLANILYNIAFLRKFM